MQTIATYIIGLGLALAVSFAAINYFETAAAEVVAALLETPDEGDQPIAP